MTANFVVNVTRYGYGEGPRRSTRHEILTRHRFSEVGRHERMKGVWVGSSIAVATTIKECLYVIPQPKINFGGTGER